MLFLIRWLLRFFFWLRFHLDVNAPVLMSTNPTVLECIIFFIYRSTHADKRSLWPIRLHFISIWIQAQLLKETRHFGCSTALKSGENKLINTTLLQYSKQRHLFTTDHTHKQSLDLGFTIYFLEDNLSCSLSPKKAFGQTTFFLFHVIILNLKPHLC